MNKELELVPQEYIDLLKDIYLFFHVNKVRDFVIAYQQKMGEKPRSYCFQRKVNELEELFEKLESALRFTGVAPEDIEWDSND